MSGSSESEIAYAAVLTHVPDTGETLYTPFTGDGAARRAKCFRRSEEECGDFPGSLWTIVYNGAADQQRVRDNLVALVGEDTGGIRDEHIRSTASRSGQTSTLEQPHDLAWAIGAPYGVVARISRSGL